MGPRKKDDLTLVPRVPPAAAGAPSAADLDAAAAEQNEGTRNSPSQSTEPAAVPGAENTPPPAPAAQPGKQKRKTPVAKEAAEETDYDRHQAHIHSVGDHS